MKKLEKVEEKLNALVVGFGKGLSGLWDKLTPSKLKATLSSLESKAAKLRSNSKQKALELKTKSIKLALESKTKLQEGSGKVTAIPKLVASKAKTVKTSDLQPTKMALALAAIFSPLLLKIKTWYLSLQPQTIAVGISFTALSSIAGLTIYTQMQKVSESTSQQGEQVMPEADRAPASAVRPKYFRKTEKQFSVSNVILPAYFRTSPKQLKKLVIDFTFESSNKYIKNYFYKNSYLIQDTLNTTIEPVSINFPLEDEGKIIIKQKIKKEMNKKLRALKIKGEIKEVNIDSVIAG